MVAGSIPRALRIAASMALLDIASPSLSSIMLMVLPPDCLNIRIMVNFSALTISLACTSSSWSASTCREPEDAEGEATGSFGSPSKEEEEEEEDDEDEDEDEDVVAAGRLKYMTATFADHFVQ